MGYKKGERQLQLQRIGFTVYTPRHPTASIKLFGKATVPLSKVFLGDDDDGKCTDPADKWTERYRFVLDLYLRRQRP